MPQRQRAARHARSSPSRCRSSPRRAPPPSRPARRRHRRQGCSMPAGRTAARSWRAPPCAAGVTAQSASSATAAPPRSATTRRRPRSAPVDLGAGRSAKARRAGRHHTCALLDDGTVRCWGFGGDGRLGYANTRVDRRRRAARRGRPGRPRHRPHRDGDRRRDARTPARVLDDGSVRCWGFGGDGRLGYGNDRTPIGDDETPGSVGPVDLGAGRTATRDQRRRQPHLRAARRRQRALLGLRPSTASSATATTTSIGDDETPGRVPGRSSLGAGRTATAIAAGDCHTCALLDDGTVRCWGYGATGSSAMATRPTIGDDEPPAPPGPVDLGAGRTAVAISAGDDHTCARARRRRRALLGLGADGRLGYGSMQSVGDDERRLRPGPVSLGAGRTAVAISAGAPHLRAARRRGRALLGLRAPPAGSGAAASADIGDDETPAAVAPVNLATAGHRLRGGGRRSRRTGPSGVDPARAGCSARATPNGSARAVGGAVSRRRARRRQTSAGGGHEALPQALGAHARPRDEGPRASPSQREVVLTFDAAGTDDARAPAARRYLVKQSRRPIRSLRDFRRADTLCGGRCEFGISRVGTRVRLGDHRPAAGTAYYYADRRIRQRLRAGRAALGDGQGADTLTGPPASADGPDQPVMCPRPRISR